MPINIYPWIRQAKQHAACTCQACQDIAHHSNFQMLPISKWPSTSILLSLPFFLFSNKIGVRDILSLQERHDILFLQMWPCQWHCLQMFVHGYLLCCAAFILANVLVGCAVAARKKRNKKKCLFCWSAILQCDIYKNTQTHKKAECILPVPAPWNVSQNTLSSSMLGVHMHQCQCQWVCVFVVAIPAVPCQGLLSVSMRFHPFVDTSPHDFSFFCMKRAVLCLFASAFHHKKNPPKGVG